MHRFSIIVPLLADVTDFDDTLASVLRHLPPQSQVIAVHDGNYTDPYGLAGEVELISSDGRPHLIRYFNRGLQAADGKFVVFIRPGVQIDENWQIAVDDAFDDLQVGSVAPVIVNANRPAKVVTAGVDSDRFNNRKLCAWQTRLAPKNLAAVSPLGPTSWLAIYRRDLLSVIGTLDERMDPHYVDLDIALSMKRLGFKCELMPDLVGEVESELPIRREAALPHGLSAQRAFQRFHRGSWAKSIAAYATELLRAVNRPSWLEHMFQRIAARRLLEIDQRFADRLSEAKQQQAWQQCETLYDNDKKRAATKRAA